MGDVAEMQHDCAADTDVPRDLLAWYDRERRDLPWRYAPGEPADPYRVWLSEIMLQQTTVKTVIPYFEKFTEAWPTVHDLADADEEAVLQAWAGLGYYSRARNLHACARQVVEEFDGQFPRREADLLSLPGIGPYTAAAIASIAHGERATPVDGNIERVVARLFAVRDPLPDAKRQLRDLAVTLTPEQRAGDFAQAMMDLGATLCTPKRPSCLVCPLQDDCEAHALGVAAELPYRAAKRAKPVRRGIAFVAVSESGQVLLRRRPDTGLLARMQEVPSTEWLDEMPVIGEALRGAPVRADWWQAPGLVVHTFTHFRLELQVYRAVVPADAELTFWADPTRCRWVPRGALHGEALPTLMRKVIAHGLAQS
ncbi:MAG: A/G-specific adenine glycosylase [Hyphomicrobiaceae bacterium]